MRDLTAATDLIEEFEGFSATPYKDQGGVSTIGIGTTKYPDGTKVTLKDKPITHEQAVIYLKHHMNKDCEAIEKFITKNKLTISDNQFCALACFAYNLGVAPVIDKGRSLCDALLLRSHLKISQAFRLYVKDNVHGNMTTVKGLVRRREAEIKLFFS